ncbi:MAG: hypothetical protein V9H69_26115 [Anaerolineae bacterium]
MKTKTIGQLCRRAMEGWVASLPQELQQPVTDDLILTGGSIASLFLGEPVNDWDVYFRSRATAKAVAEHYVGLFVAHAAARPGGQSAAQAGTGGRPRRPGGRHGQERGHPDRALRRRQLPLLRGPDRQRT